jgi:CheY-like chemotaxis protein
LYVTGGASLFALSRSDGALLYSVLLDRADAAMLWSSPKLVDGLLVIGVASFENGTSLEPTFIGSVVALEADSGKEPPGGASDCEARVERRLFGYGLCACDALQLTGDTFLIDSFDSRNGVYKAGQTGGSVGVGSARAQFANHTELDITVESNSTLVLGDIMPGIGGLGVLAHIQGHTRGGHVPVVLITAHSERSHRLLGLRAGADEFLEKPIDVPIMVASVNALLRLKQSGDELQLSRNALVARNSLLESLQRAARAHAVRRARREKPAHRRAHEPGLCSVAGTQAERHRDVRTVDRRRRRRAPASHDGRRLVSGLEARGIAAAATAARIRR